MLRHISSPLRLFAGSGCLSGLAPELTRAGCRNGVLLTSPSMQASVCLAQVQTACGDLLAATLTGVRRNSPRTSIEALRQRLQDLNADGVVALGGGSVMVSARAAVILLGEDRPLETLATTRGADGRMVSPRLDRPKLPIFAIPTTPTTAMAKPGSAVLDMDTRLSLFDPKTRPRAIFLDDACLDSAPPDVTRRAAANTLASAVEGLMAAGDPIAEGMLLQSLRLLGPGAARRDLAMAALLCAQGTDHTGLGLATGLSHALSVICGVDGGTAKAIVLPHVLPLVPAAGRARLAGFWACDDTALPRRLADALALFEPARRLREVGVAGADLTAVAGACGDDWFVRSSGISPERIEAVLRAAW